MTGFNETYFGKVIYRVIYQDVVPENGDAYL